MDRRLVVNADDAGLDPARDAAILAAADRGVVRSASVVANGPTAEAFVAAARRVPGLSIGLHVNLTTGRALAGRAFTLTEPDGSFLGRKDLVWRRAVDGQVDAREVEEEVLAQWRRLKALGAEPDHVDGHHHVHVLPGIAEGVVGALLALRAHAFVRVPAEAMPPAGTPHVSEPAIPLGTTVLSRARLAQMQAGHGAIAAIGAHADAFRGFLRKGLRTTEGFTGLAFGVAPSAAALRALVAAAPGGTVEAMAHPGRVDGLGAFSSDARRDEEALVLRDPALRADLESDGVALVSFRDLLA
jgi:predicted glycoside hydrolase/deacetylase ChbG (UPF0249 family)